MSLISLARRLLLTLSVIAVFNIIGHAQIDAQVGIYLKSLTVNQREGYFKADIYWWIKLPLTFDETHLDEYSEIEFVNGTEVSKSVVEKKKTKDLFYVTGNYKGEFQFDPDYHEYPIDVQRLPIVLESVNMTEDYVKLTPDRLPKSKSRYAISMEEGIVVPGFTIIEADYEKQSKVYESNFGDPDYSPETKYSRITCEVKIKRDSTSFILKIVTPNILLLVITYLVFFIPAKNLEVAVGCTVTSLLASIALQLTTNGSLPEIGYLTNADKLFHLFYLLITLALVQTVLTYNLEKMGRKKMSYRLEVLGRVFFPIMLAAGIVFILY